MTMIRTKLWIMSAVCLPLAAAMAQTANAPEELFQAHETSLDLFGSLSVGQETIDNISGESIEEDGEFGAGVGLNYFFTRMLGLGADAYSENTHGPFVDNTSANLILRFPLDKIRLAPYLYGGGGYQFDPGEVWFAQAGAGLEFRFNEGVGLFTDARYVMTDETENFGVARLGLRISF
jgi:hypothetical protein